MDHTAYGVGADPSSVLSDRLLGTYGDRLQNSSARPAAGYGGGGGYDDLPLSRGTGGAAYGGLAVTMAWAALAVLHRDLEWV